MLFAILFIASNYSRDDEWRPLHFFLAEETCFLSYILNMNTNARRSQHLGLAKDFDMS